MDCNEIRNLLPAHVDGELDVRESLALDLHLRGCAGCRAQYEMQNAVRGALARDATYFRAPATLEARIRDALPSSPTPSPAVESRRAWRWPRLAAGFASVVAVAWILGAYVDLSRDHERLTDEVISSHIRSLLSNHTVDVASSDQHTVKPWFNGKLDFSPPVTDFADKGFPLLGGRLEYIAGRSVSALIYGRRQHVINVLLWPRSGGDGAPAMRTRQGYHVLHWVTPDYSYWAVSDLGLAELQQFKQLLQQGDSAAYQSPR
jgi:anti-sigma factor RsiW